MNPANQNISLSGENPLRRAVAPAVNDYVQGIRAGNVTILARAITLIESQARAHEDQAQEILQRLIPDTGKSKRIGITGIPGVGKSTFIEALGCNLIGQGHQVAVLTIDPSSILSGGSILGDKTRMERLSRETRAFIRPTAAGDTPGGVARRTRETMLLCEAAGFDIILVETVGVGQGEMALRSMVDFFLLLLLPGAGDELQGIKKGVIELADLVLINKADGDNRLRAAQARAEQQAALACQQSTVPGWKTELLLCSGQTGEGLPEAWERIEQFYRELEPRGVIACLRRKQMLDWLAELVRDELPRRFYQDPRVRACLPGVEEAVLNGRLTVPQAAAALLAARNGSAEVLERKI